MQSLASQLLSAQGNPRPDDVTEHYATKGGCSLRVNILPDPEGEGSPSVLIEGDKETLLFLADLLLAQASDDLDCGVGISPRGPGCALFSKNSEYGIYVHSLPCVNGEIKVRGEAAEGPGAE
jgi:hypothetical protein